MSEYWKSTPKYWCKHCSVFVRDTKLERSNHESTGKHQGAIKRSLRDIHRNAEQQDREKERAKREVERLNGVVSGKGNGSGSSSATTAAPGASKGSYGAPPKQVTEAERQKQLEQLAELGVNIPTDLRSNMAMPGEWTVTTTRVIKNTSTDGGNKDLPPDEARATGVKRERERTEEEKEQEAAINGLFNKRRKWGVGSKTMPTEGDAELDELLSGSLFKAKKEDSDEPAKVKEEPKDTGVRETKVSFSAIKKEPGAEETDAVKADVAPAEVAAEEKASLEPPEAEAKEEAEPAAAVVFKKRKPKNLRQK